MQQGLNGKKLEMPPQNWVPGLSCAAASDITKSAGYSGKRSVEENKKLIVKLIKADLDKKQREKDRVEKLTPDQREKEQKQKKCTLSGKTPTVCQFYKEIRKEAAKHPDRYLPLQVHQL